MRWLILGAIILAGVAMLIAAALSYDDYDDV